MPNEKLPLGFTRRPSGSLRVRIRLKGHPLTERNFPLTSDAPEERMLQLQDAKAWHAETIRQLKRGVHRSTHAAETITLGAALRSYKEKAGVGRKESNVANEEYRFRVILEDPIAQLRIAQIRKSNVAAFRDRLIDQWYEKKARQTSSELKRIEALPIEERSARATLLEEVPKFRRQARTAANEDQRRALEQRAAEICGREGIGLPPKTTISNIVQLIGRALKHAGETVDGVPDISGVSMPPATKGRDRRLKEGEEQLLLDKAAQIGPLLPLIISFAIESALRREHILGLRWSNIRSIGVGRRAIVIPSDPSKREKRAGVVPITRRIESIISEASQHQPDLGRSADACIFPVHPEALKSQWRRLMDMTGIEDLHFHDLRHEGTSRLFERGLNTAEVMSITGHSTTEMVDRYSHYSAVQVLKKLEAGLSEEYILTEIAFLVEQYSSLNPDLTKLAALIRP